MAVQVRRADGQPLLDVAQVAVEYGGTVGSTTNKETARSCARTGSDAVWCWGDNRFGQLGDGTMKQRTRAVLRSDGKPLGGIASISISGLQVCARTRSATAWCSGSNLGANVLGAGRSDLVVTRAVRVRTTAGATYPDVTSIAPGGTHTCLTRADRTVWCVGKNPTGALGDGTTTTRTRWVRPTGWHPRWSPPSPDGPSQGPAEAARAPACTATSSRTVRNSLGTST